MSFRAWRALAHGVVLDSVRRKDLWVVAILGFLIVCSAGALGFFGMQGLEAFAKDLAASVLGLFSTALAVIVASRVVPEETKNRTLYPLLARPISRLDLLVGKWLGAVLVTWIAFGLLCALTALSLAMFGVRFEAVMAQYVLCKAIGLALVCSFSLVLSVFMTPSAATTLSFVIAFGSGAILRAMVMVYESASHSIQPLFKAAGWIVPQFGLFDLGGRAANSGWPMVPAWVVGSLVAYAVVYSAVLLCLAWLRFRRLPL